MGALGALTAFGLLSSVANPETAQTAIRFRNVARQAGIDFVLENHPTPRKHLIETMAGGVAAFDYDNDGRPDLFFTNGAEVPSLVKSSPKDRNRLFHNEGGFRFRDATENSGLTGSGYSTAVAVGDFDNDGRLDLFVGGVRENRLYRNEGSGKFKDVTQAGGIASGQWCQGAGWLDYDNDGLLDLFVVNYLQWTPEFDTFCGDRATNTRAYCHPRLFQGTPNLLYHNNGDGTFHDLSEKAGISRHTGKGMGVSIADYDHDGFPDVFVPNDKIPNFLFHNKGNGTFEEAGLDAGVALLDGGVPISSMGSDFRDYNNDGHPDVVFAALAGETFPFFVNTAKSMFLDAGQSSKMAVLTHRISGWSIGLFDLDNDGWKDAFTANGHVNDTVESFEAAKYKLTNSVFANAGGGKFVDASVSSGLDREPPRAHRGAAFADFNQDGKIDVVTVSLGEAAEVWENVTSNGNSWIVLKLTGTKSNRQGIGSEIRIGDQQNHVTTAVGYLSSSDSPVHFGAGSARSIARIEVRWSSGVRQLLENVAANSVVEVKEP